MKKKIFGRFVGYSYDEKLGKDDFRYFVICVVIALCVIGGIIFLGDSF